MVQTQTDIPPGRIDAALNALDTLASESLAKTGVPGMAIAVVHHDQQIFARGYGVRAAGTSDAVDADTVFRLASVSKPLASTVTAGLVGDGHVSWDARIGDIDPAIEMFDPWVTRELTIRDLSVPPQRHAGVRQRSSGRPRLRPRNDLSPAALSSPGQQLSLTLRIQQYHLLVRPRGGGRSRRNAVGRRVRRAPV